MKLGILLAVLLTFHYYFDRVACARLKKHALTHAKPLKLEITPLHGCQSNFWEKTCCCFIDSGILKQSKCTCAADQHKCQNLVPVTYSREPSRPIVSENQTVEACSNEISVQGVPHQTQANGVFLKQSLLPTSEQAGRPIYKQSNGMYLYYWKKYDAWRIGDDYRAEKAVVDSKTHEKTTCPTDASAWFESYGGQWQWEERNSIRVVKVMGLEKMYPQYLARKRWVSADGYLHGFQAVEDDFCRASPVVGPQIDSNERPYHCTCSTSTGHTVEMECGSSCSVENCIRWKDNAASTKLDWKPILEGRGKCCLSSFASNQDGCPEDATPITASGATAIVTDALQQALLWQNQRKSFVIKSSEHLVGDMSKAFATAREKKMHTSRSGAQFFFSEGTDYILKSIQAAEYDVLSEIAATRMSGSSPLLEHIARFRLTAEQIKLSGNCIERNIWRDVSLPRPEYEGNQDNFALLQQISSSIPKQFFGAWWFDDTVSMRIGAPVYTRPFYTIGEEQNLMAVWCKNIRRWALLRMAQGMNQSYCEYHDEDALYGHLNVVAANIGADALLVHTVHDDFMSAFHSNKHSFTKVHSSAHVFSECTTSWYPASLINDFVLAFRYQASSTWMVVRNSVAAISHALEKHGFTIYHKGHDVFDVKPLPIISDQRETLFGMYFVRSKLEDWKNWMSVRTNLYNDVAFMDKALPNPMVDYSLLVSVFYVDDSRSVLDDAAVDFPNCIEKRLSMMHYYGNADGSILVCFTIIDMLMEFTFAKTPENALLFGKWSNWGEKIMHMFDCLGTPLAHGCSKYDQYLAKYEGVDLPSIRTASVIDVTDYFSAAGEVKTKNARGIVIQKCCCRAGHGYSSMGTCRVVETRNASGWGNSNSCPSLVASGWRSFQREAKHCRIPWQDTAALRETLADPDYERISL